MKQLFKITEITDPDGYKPYVGIYYIMLENEHYEEYNPFELTNGLVKYRLTDIGKQYVQELTGIHWCGYYDIKKVNADEELSEIKKELDLLTSRKNNLDNVLGGNLIFAPITYYKPPVK